VRERERKREREQWLCAEGRARAEEVQQFLFVLASGFLLTMERERERERDPQAVSPGKENMDVLAPAVASAPRQVLQSNCNWNVAEPAAAMTALHKAKSSGNCLEDSVESQTSKGTVCTVSSQSTSSSVSAPSSPLCSSKKEPDESFATTSPKIRSGSQLFHSKSRRSHPATPCGGVRRLSPHDMEADVMKVTEQLTLLQSPHAPVDHVKSGGAQFRAGFYRHRRQPSGDEIMADSHTEKVARYCSEDRNVHSRSNDQIARSSERNDPNQASDETGRFDQELLSGNSQSSLKRRRGAFKADLRVNIGDSSSSSNKEKGSSCSFSVESRTQKEAKPGKSRPSLDKGAFESNFHLDTPPAPFTSRASRDEPADPPVTIIRPYLSIGSQSAFALGHELFDVKFTAVIDCTSSRAGANHCSTLSPPPGVRKLSLRLRDNLKQDISSRFWPAVKFIEEERKRNGHVFVFCQKGISRSASIVLAYLVWKGLTNKQAQEELKQKRSKVAPNLGFLVQLDSWASQRPSVNPGKLFKFEVALSDEDTFVLSGEEGACKERIMLAFGPLETISSTTPREEGAPVPEGPRCWLIVAPTVVSYQLVYMQKGVPDELRNGAIRLAELLVELENCPSDIEFVEEGQDSVRFSQLSKHPEMTFSPRLRSQFNFS